MPIMDYFGWMTSGNGGVGSLPSTQAMMGNIFSDDFESLGFTNWNQSTGHPTIEKFDVPRRSASPYGIQEIESEFPSFFNPNGFDAEGRYGMTADMRHDARWRGLGQLGASLIAGANSGSWGGMAKGLSQGMSVAGDTQDAYLDKLSKQKLSQAITQEQMRMSEMDYKGKKLVYEETKDKRAREKEARAAAQELYDNRIAGMRAAAQFEPDEGKKNELQAYLAQMDIAVKSGDTEKLTTAFGNFFNNTSDAVKTKLNELQSVEEAKARGAATGRISGTDAAVLAQFPGGVAPPGWEKRWNPQTNTPMWMDPQSIAEEEQDRRYKEASINNLNRDRTSGQITPVKLLGLTKDKVRLQGDVAGLKQQDQAITLELTSLENQFEAEYRAAKADSEASKAAIRGTIDPQGRYQKLKDMKLALQGKLQDASSTLSGIDDMLTIYGSDAIRTGGIDVDAIFEAGLISAQALPQWEEIKKKNAVKSGSIMYAEAEKRRKAEYAKLMVQSVSKYAQYLSQAQKQELDALIKNYTYNDGR